MTTKAPPADKWVAVTVGCWPMKKDKGEPVVAAEKQLYKDCCHAGKHCTVLSLI